jgi:hypothetical protein
MISTKIRENWVMMGFTDKNEFQSEVVKIFTELDSDRIVYYAGLVDDLRSLYKTKYNMMYKGKKRIEAKDLKKKWSDLLNSVGNPTYIISYHTRKG